MDACQTTRLIEVHYDAWSDLAGVDARFLGEIDIEGISLLGNFASRLASPCYTNICSYIMKLSCERMFKRTDEIWIRFFS
jgi:hypothetical protein